MAAQCAPQRRAERAGDARGQNRPRVPSVVRKQRRQPDPDDDGNRDRPVVTNHEVEQEPGKAGEPLHAGATEYEASARRSNATNAKDMATTNATRTTSGTSPPGHAMPAPSALQK